MIYNFRFWSNFFTRQQITSAWLQPNRRSSKQIHASNLRYHQWHPVDKHFHFQSQWWTQDGEATFEKAERERSSQKRERGLTFEPADGEPRVRETRPESQNEDNHSNGESDNSIGRNVISGTRLFTDADILWSAWARSGPLVNLNTSVTTALRRHVVCRSARCWRCTDEAWLLQMQHRREAERPQGLSTSKRTWNPVHELD